MRSAKEGPAGQDTFDTEYKIASGLSLQNVTISASFANFSAEALRFVHRKHQDAAAQASLTNARGSLQPAHPWHGDIENYDVRLQILDGFEALCGSGCFTRDFPPRPQIAEQGPNSSPHNFMIVNDKNSRVHSSSPKPIPQPPPISM